jgi:hypothetical protein
MKGMAKGIIQDNEQSHGEETDQRTIRSAARAERKGDHAASI